MAKRSQMKTPGGGRGGGRGSGGGGAIFRQAPPNVRGRHVFSNGGEMVHAGNSVPTRTRTQTHARTDFLSHLFRNVCVCVCVFGRKR